MPRSFIGIGSRALVGLVLTTTTVRAGEVPSHLVFRFEGGAGERYGRAAAVVGDVDGDGVVDVATGAPLADDAAPASGAIEVRSGATGLVLAKAQGDSAFDAFGAALAGPGDLDGDGVPDIVVGAPGGAPPAGSVVALSGSDGGLLWTAVGVDTGDRFGHALAAIGDADGDGFVDVVVGSPDHDGGGFGAGRAEVRSGASGALHWSIDGGAFLDQLGRAVAGVGDVDADGTPDVALGAPLSDVSAFNGGAVFVRSGSSGGLLVTVGGAGVADQLGFSIDGAGDVDGDGRADVVVGVPAADGAGIDAGRAEIRRGNDGALLLAVDGAGAGESAGFVAGLGDVDADGTPDFAVGAPSASAFGEESGVVRLHSGASGALLAALPGPSPKAWFGQTVAAAGDVDGDGVPELLVGAPVHDDDVTLAGTAWLLSTRPRALVASAHAVSASSGGTVTLRLSSHPPTPGASWILLGSTSGTSPGTMLGGVVLPLVGDDPYFAFRIQHPTAPPLAPALGALDDAGGAVATFALAGPLPPAWVGTTVHHAALVLPLGGAGLLATPAVPITLVP